MCQNSQIHQERVTQRIDLQRCTEILQDKIDNARTHSALDCLHHRTHRSESMNFSVRPNLEAVANFYIAVSGPWRISVYRVLVAADTMAYHLHGT